MTKDTSLTIDIGSVDNAADYPEDERDYNGSGVHIDASNVQIHEMTLVTISC